MNLYYRVPKCGPFFGPGLEKLVSRLALGGWVGQPEKDREEYYHGSWHLADHSHAQTFRLESTTPGMSTCLKQSLGIFHVRLHV